MKELASVDIAILLVYLLGIVGIGLWVGRKGRSSDQFMVAGRSLPGWAVGLSIFGTYVSSISFLALPGKAFSSNWNAFVFSLSIPFTAVLAVFYFMPFYRQLARMGTIMYLLALALSPMTGWSVVTLILITGVMVIAYTLIGGIEAVIWTDVVQSIVLIGGAVLCVLILFLGMPQEPGEVFKVASQYDKFGLGSFSMSFSESTFWVVLIYGIFINLQNFGIDQNYIQRYVIARTDREAAKSVWLGALLYLPVSAVFFFIGTQLFAYYTSQPELLPAGTKPDQVFPHFIATGLPIGVGGIVIAAIFAAAQSTLSTSVNCSATLILCDLYRRYIRPFASERESMLVLRISTLAIGAGGTFTALAMIHVKSALDAWWELAGIFSGGMLGLFLLGIISRRAKNAAAATGVIIGVLIIFWMSLSPAWTGEWAQFRSPFHKFMVVVIGTLAILLVGILISRFTKGKNPRSFHCL